MRMALERRGTRSSREDESAATQAEAGPDLILTDISMPRQMVASGAPCAIPEIAPPILVTTGFGAAMRLLARAGRPAYEPKPSSRNLLATVEVISGR